MGRGTVAGGGAAGLYSLALDVGKAERDAAVAKMDARLAELTPKIAELQAALEAAEAARDEARGLAQAAISAYADAMRADPEGDHQALADEVQARIEVAVQLEGEAAKVRIPLEEAQAEKAQLDKDRAVLLAVPVERTVSAWCVDLTENASGQVATLEVPGEPARVLIAPGGRAPADADGRLLARGVMSPAQAFWNAAVLPGWQKWKPDYRTGTLTALDQDTDRGTVVLDDLTSSAQGLRVNQANVLTDVPVVYMTCNAQAFEVGDRVVVAFDGRDWANPRVIGFVSNPKRCSVYVFFSLKAVSRLLPLPTGGISAIVNPGTNIIYPDGVVNEFTYDDFRGRMVDNIRISGGEKVYIVESAADAACSSDIISAGEELNFNADFSYKNFASLNYSQSFGPQGVYAEYMPAMVDAPVYNFSGILVPGEPSSTFVISAEVGITKRIPWGFDSFVGLSLFNLDSEKVFFRLNHRYAVSGSEYRIEMKVVGPGTVNSKSYIEGLGASGYIDMDEESSSIKISDFPDISHNNRLLRPVDIISFVAGEEDCWDEDIYYLMDDVYERSTDCIGWVGVRYDSSV